MVLAQIKVPIRPGIKPKMVNLVSLTGPNIKFINIEVPGGVTIKQVSKVLKSPNLLIIKENIGIFLFSPQLNDYKKSEEKILNVV